MNKKPDHISFSQINAAKCLYHYEQTRLLEKYKHENDAILQGKIVHEVIYEYTAYCVKNRTDADFEELDKIIHNKCDQYNLNNDFFQSVRDICLKFGESGVNFDIILECEKRDTITIGQDKNGKDINIMVVIDRTNSYTDTNGNTILEIIDYKNNINVYSKTDVETDDQLKTYKYIACNYLYQNYDFVRIGIYHTRHGFIRWGDMQKVKELGNEFEGIEKWLIRQWDRIHNAEKYEPEKCEVCFKYNGCPILNDNKCPLYTDEEVKKMAVGSIEDKIRAYRKMKKDTMDMEKQIKEHFKSDEPKNIDGKDVGYFPAKSYKYNLNMFYVFSVENNIDISDFQISKTDCDKALKKAGILDPEEIKPMQIETMSNNFKI